MIRIAGILLLAGGSALLGLCAVRHMNCRVEALRQLMIGMETMRRELNYRLLPLPEMLASAAEQCTEKTGDFFRLCAEGASHLNGRTFQDVWWQVLEAVQLRLELEDMQIVGQLGAVLGRYDGDSQRQALEAAVIQLKQQFDAAAEQSRRLGKVYGVLGLTAGAFLIILLI